MMKTFSENHHEKKFLFQKFLCMVLSIVMVVAIVPTITITALAQVYTDKCGENLAWSLDTETGVLKIEGTGELTDFELASRVPWKAWSDAVKSVELPYGITYIPNYSFMQCENLVSIDIPDTVKSIGERAFYSCKSLTEINIPDSVSFIGSEAFHYCEKLLSVDIPDGVSAIEYATFASCDALENVCIPDSVTTIKDKAFSHCKSLKSVIISDNVKELGAEAFCYCVSLQKIILSNTITEIAERTFYNCRSLTEIIIPSSVINIGSEAFSDCLVLSSVVIPYGVKRIGASAFCNCISLESINIPDSVTTIESRAFYECMSLTEITLPNSIEYFGHYTFGRCTALEFVKIPKYITNIAVGMFSNCKSLVEVVIPNGVVNIENHAFEYCKSLTEIALPESVKNIDYSAFLNCTSLSKINIPGEVEYISNSAFCNCISLKAIAFSDNVSTIENEAFAECNSLGDVYYSGSKQQWAQVKIDSLNNDVLLRANIHYNSIPCDILGHTYSNGECTVCKKWQYKNTAVTLKSVKNTTSGVYLSWSKLPGATKYAVYRKTTGGWTKLTTNATGTSFTDKTAKNNVKYTYTVRAINGSEYNTTYNKTGLKVTFMSAPKITSVTNAATGVTVKWGKVSGATVYYVYRKTTGGWTKLGSTKSTSFTDTKAKAGTKYTYTIIAAKSGVKSSYYSGKAIVRLTVPKLTKLTATSKKNTLTFGKVTGATSYIIYRKTGNGGWQRIATTKSTKYVDTKIKKGTYYTYTVRAVRGTSASYYNIKGLKVRAK